MPIGTMAALFIFPSTVRKSSKKSGRAAMSINIFQSEEYTLYWNRIYIIFKDSPGRNPLLQGVKWRLWLQILTFPVSVFNQDVCSKNTLALWHLKMISSKVHNPLPMFPRQSPHDIPHSPGTLCPKTPRWGPFSHCTMSVKLPPLVDAGLDSVQNGSK